jgi:peptide-methionine (S)-S-oxide reductase
VTTVEPLTTLYPAEDYHKEYFRYHTGAPYCQLVINPKLEKITAEFSDFIKKQ